MSTSTSIRLDKESQLDTFGSIGTTLALMLIIHSLPSSNLILDDPLDPGKNDVVASRGLYW